MIVKPVKNPVYSYFKKNMGVLVGFLLLCIITSILSDKFLALRNITNILRQISSNALLAFGMTFVILTGGIDLSVGSVIAVSGAISLGLLQKGAALSICLLAGIVIGLAFGLVNGSIVAYSGMPPFITTLSTMIMGRGIAYIYMGGMTIRSNNKSFNAIGSGYLGPVPFPVIIMILLFCICWLLLNKTRFGRYVYAIGGNQEAAFYSGVNVKKTKIMVYSLSGVLAAAAGIIIAARTYSAIPTAGDGAEMDAIASVVLGGTSFTGGIGTLGSTFIGALIMGVLSNSLNLLEVPFYYQLVLKGIIILIAVYLDTIKKSRIRLA
jgi:ribose transport system permease protein